MMKAINLPKKSPAEVVEVPKPAPNHGEVLVKVAYSALDTALEEVAKRSFIPGSLFHDFKSKPCVAGWHFSGTIDSISDDATDFKVGDAVFGHLQYSSSTIQGSWSEYITVPISECAKVPDGIEMDSAAAVTTEALTALQSLRDQAHLSEGQSVLVIAAGGGVGTQAVQIAKAMKAGAIHAVCSTKDVSRVEGLGVDVVIDRSKVDITKTLEPKSYDVIFDTTAGKYKFGQLKYALKKKGVVLFTVPNLSSYRPFNWLVSSFTGKHSKTIFMVKCNCEDLELVGTWMKAGGLKVPIDSTFDIKDFEAAREANKGIKSGRVVMKIEGGW